MRVCDVKGCRREVESFLRLSFMGYDICRKHRKIIEKFIEEGRLK